MVSFNTIKFCSKLGCKLNTSVADLLEHIAYSFKIGEKIKTSEIVTHPFKIGATRTKQTISPMSTKDQIEHAAREMSGATQQAELNKSFIIHKPRRARSYIHNPILTSDMSSLEPTENIELFCKDFKARTGLNLHIPDNWNLSSNGMNDISVYIRAGIDEGKFPPDIKHVIMSHGEGLSTNGTWKFCGSHQSVPEWINEHIPQGEKCLVAVCEDNSPTWNKLRPGIGHHVTNSFTNADFPAKIMRSGNNSIIGHYVRGTGAVYY